MNTAERAARNTRIAEERSRGASWQPRHGLSESQARRAAREGLGGAEGVRQVRRGAREALARRREGLVVDPAAVLSRVVGIHDRALDRLEALATTGDNSSVRLGAARSAPVVAASLLDTLSRAGLLPPTPATWRNARDMRLVAEALVKVADRRGLDPDEVLAEFERAQRVELGPVEAA